MKKLYIVLVALFLVNGAMVLMFLNSCKSGSNKLNPPHPYGGEIRIGIQVWMGKNLEVVRFRNGDTIPQAKTIEEWKKASEDKQPAWCYYNNDSSMGVYYGKLYNGYAVNDSRGLAPFGWHIPSYLEWEYLTNHCGGEYNAGAYLKSTSGWKTWVTDGNGNGDNLSGFNARPAGIRNYNGYFMFLLYKSSFWSSTGDTLYASYAWSRTLTCANYWLIKKTDNKGNGFSVRCIKGM
jgi:uncharacterized protein (TIGR02145 family)